MPPNYRLRSITGLSVRELDGEYAVYLADARETHLLSDQCFQVLELLKSGPMTVETILDKMNLLFEVAEDNDFRTILVETVDSLVETGIVEAIEDKP